MRDRDQDSGDPASDSKSFVSASDPVGPDSTLTEAAGSWTAAPVPEAVGDYRIVGKLGEGGMGIVYEAEQQNPRRRVALKVVRGGRFVDDLQLRMFRREVDTLARLKHPNIGAIYESGCTEEGQHFFTMELVRGETLDAYLRRHREAIDRREIERRLLLFCKIADAVHHAHQRGVIHRDLKPANLIVPETTPKAGSSMSNAGVSEVKILDFGLARLVDADVAGETLLTRAGTLRGTLGYMSPEQTQGDPQVDVRVDVYALGVILYEMLTGARPYETGHTRLLESVRVICEEPPRSLAQRWRGTRKPDADLETIVAKALEKDPDRRYPGAAALAEDIRRYLASQPILARQPSATYQLKKLVARHKLPFAFAVTLALLVIGFGVGMSVLYARAVEAEVRATKEAETAESALGFMIDMFQMSDPGEALGDEITVRQILDRGAAEIEHEFADQPEIQARLIATVGWVYRGLGIYGQAEPLLERSLEIRRELLGSEHRRTLQSMNDLAVVYANRGRHEDAERLHDEALATQRRVLGPDDPDTLRSMSNLASLYENQRRYESAEQLYKDTIERQRRVLGDDHPETLGSMNNLAVVYINLGRYESAEPLQRAALEGRRQVLGENHPDTLASLNNLAVLHQARGRLDEAERLYLDSLERHRRVLGEDHPGTLTSLYNLGNVYLGQGQRGKAESSFLEALERQRRVLGEDHPDTLDTTYNLACVAALDGRKDEAFAYLNRALDHGYTYGGDPAGMLTDPDLESLHGEPEFEAIEVRVRGMPGGGE